ncbi:MAG TPA: isoprenylcysteine carboxylmethyltransferase family protein [Xanthobacteraceae bacterium]
MRHTGSAPSPACDPQAGEGTHGIEGTRLVAQLTIRTAAWLAAFALLLFVSAGTVDWPAGWIYLAEMGGLWLAIGLWLARHDPGLLSERLAGAFVPAQRAWDKAIIAIFMVLWIGWLVLGAFDAVRFQWSQVPAWLQGIGAVAIALGYYVFYLTFRENSYAAPVVSIQRERGHRVVSTGPYALVRHPMYAGTVPFFIGTALLLGSWWGLATAPILIAVLAGRAVLEERTLAEELPGYRQYAARVRYRFFPGIW